MHPVTETADRALAGHLPVVSTGRFSHGLTKAPVSRGPRDKQRPFAPRARGGTGSKSLGGELSGG